QALNRVLRTAKDPTVANPTVGCARGLKDFTVPHGLKPRTRYKTTSNLGASKGGPPLTTAGRSRRSTGSRSSRRTGSVTSTMANPAGQKRGTMERGRAPPHRPSHSTPPGAHGPTAVPTPSAAGARPPASAITISRDAAAPSSAETQDRGARP